MADTPAPASAEPEPLSDELKAWIGRSRTVEDEITLPAVRRIAATFDLDPDSFRHGSALPPTWYTLFFPDIARQSAIGHDGHPQKGEFLPPIPLPRRMFAGRRVRVLGELRVGDRATKRTEVVSITPKRGRTGLMMLLGLRLSIEAGGRPVATEENEAVYREAVAPGGANKPTPPQPAPAGPAWTQTMELDPVLVFRYSAITFNGHRIHYDADYSRQQEGYPGCVQNGGLTQQLVVDAALRHTGTRLLGYSARLVRPLWVGDAITLAGHAPKDGKISAWAADKTGALCATLELEVAA